MKAQILAVSTFALLVALLAESGAEEQAPLAEIDQEGKQLLVYFQQRNILINKSLKTTFSRRSVFLYLASSRTTPKTSAGSLARSG